MQTANKELSAVIKDLESENTKLLKRTLDDAKEIKWMRQTTLKCMENEDMSHAYFHAKEEEITRLSTLKERQSKEIINLLTKCNTYKQDYEDIKKKYDKLLEEMLKKERNETICPTLLNNHLGEEAAEFIRSTSK